MRGGKTIPLKANVDEALRSRREGVTVKSVIVVKRTGGDINWFARPRRLAPLRQIRAVERDLPTARRSR